MVVFTPRKYSWYSFLRLSQPQGHGVARRIMSIKNSNDTLGNRTGDLPGCSIVPQPTVPPHAPYVFEVLCFLKKYKSTIQKKLTGT
jgi:hypothetical protein